MDFLDCKICEIPYDEGEHRPRHAPCGHELCSACIEAVINDSIFECPKCRQKNKVDSPDDLPVSFGLIDVIRAFKAQNITFLKYSAATNDDVCKAHHKKIEHRCLKCKLWICNDDCIDSHSMYTGCTSITSSNAVSNMKEEHTKELSKLMSMFEEDSMHVAKKIQECNVKRKDFLEKAEKLKEEVDQLNNLIEQGKMYKDKLVESESHLKATNSPLAVMDRIEVFTQSKQALHSWSTKNFKTDSVTSLQKELRENKTVYVELIIKNEKKHGKLSQQKENMYVHTFLKQTTEDRSICMPFDHLQKLIPSSTSLLFLELSIGGTLKGMVHLRIDINLPKIREHVVKLVTGQYGTGFYGIQLKCVDGDSLGTGYLPFKDIPVSPDISGSCIANRGDVVVDFENGYVELMNFHVATCNYTDHCCIIGSIESGMDIIQECYNIYIEDGRESINDWDDNYSNIVNISDCGFIIDHM